jgi:hypothetical protein
MKSTFRIEGIGANGNGVTGTVFILGKPSKKDSTKAYLVLITANHVLNDIISDNAILFLRKEVNNKYIKYPWQIKIREKGKPIWIKHPEVDVAAMYVPLGFDEDIPLLPAFFLATDSLISEYGIHPGDELLCLGYPYGASSNEAGFPILRSGKISSYPILPTKEIKSFMYDFRVFGGNSGGPVYFIGTSRPHRNTLNLGEEIRFIMGLVSEELIMNEEIKSLTEVTTRGHQLGLAKVIPASFIQETINLLPDIEK